MLRVWSLWLCRLGPSMPETDINCGAKDQVEGQLAGHANRIQTSKGRYNFANITATEKAYMQFIQFISVSLQHFIKNIIEKTNILKR